MIGKIIIAIIILVVLVGGGYWYMNRATYEGTAQTLETQTATTTPQVEGQDVKIGDGAEATPGSIVSILYVGMLQDGTVFDSSANNNNEPLVFQLGAEGIIPGFQIGVNGMKVGGERRIAIPPELAYGVNGVKDATGNTVIPPNATLVFDIQLVKVEPAPTIATTTKTKTEE